MSKKDQRYWNQRDFVIDLLKQLPSYIFWKNTECTYLGCNDIFAYAVGLSSPQEIIGKNDFDLPTTKEESAAYQADDKEVMRSGKPKLNIEETQTFPDGRKIVLLTSKVPLLNKNHKVIGVLGIYTDITDRKRLEEDLREAKKAAEVANKTEKEMRQAVTVLAGSMAHDMRTPLAIIEMCSDSIKKFLPALVNTYHKAKTARLPLMEELSTTELKMLEKTGQSIQETAREMHDFIDVTLKTLSKALKKELTEQDLSLCSI